MDLQLTNKNALVGGSTQGIGKATAIALASEGANVTLIARNEDTLKTVLKELAGPGEHGYIVADFSRPEELEKALAGKNNFHIFIGLSKAHTAIEVFLPYSRIETIPHKLSNAANAIHTGIDLNRFKKR